MQREILQKTGKPLESKESMMLLKDLLPKLLSTYYIKDTDFAIGNSKIFLKASANR